MILLIVQLLEYVLAERLADWGFGPRLDPLTRTAFLWWPEHGVLALRIILMLLSLFLIAILPLLYYLLVACYLVNTFNMIVTYWRSTND